MVVFLIIYIYDYCPAMIQGKELTPTAPVYCVSIFLL